MNKTIQRFISVLLCACLLAGAAYTPAAGAGVGALAAKGCGCGEIVQVYVDGWGGNALYRNEGTPDQREVDMFTSDGLAVPILKFITYIAFMPLSFNGASIANAARVLLSAVLADFLLEGVTASWKLDTEQNHTESPEYRYPFDWRGDPLAAADGLNDYIEALCAHTGHKKIALTGHSEGANVVMAYLKKYGSGRLDSLLLVNGAWQGLELIGQLLTGKLELSGSALTYYVADLDDGSGVLLTAMDIVRCLRLLDILGPLSRGIVAAGGDALYDEAVMPLFGQMMAIWSFVPAEYYGEVRNASKAGRSSRSCWPGRTSTSTASSARQRPC